MSFDKTLLGLPSEDPNELMHYGVKGMRWGVRKSETPTGRDYSDAAASMPRLTAPQAVVKRQQAAESLMIKSNGSEAGQTPSRHLTPGQKKAIYIGVGALAAAAVVGGAYAYSKQGGSELPPSAVSYLDQIRETNRVAFVKGAPPFHPTALSRQGFSLSPGHVFSRVSNTAETTFGGATYTSFTSDDYNRYLGEGYGRVIDYAPLHRIQFSAKEEIRVPSFTDTVETLRETLSATTGKSATPKEALSEYYRLQGSFFDDPVGSKLVENLRRKGYSAIVDEMDAGRISDRPLVIIDPSKFTSKVATPLTPADVIAARKLMTPLSNPKL